MLKIKRRYADIEAWALSNGFAVDHRDGRLKAPYGEAHVIIEPLARDFRVVMESAGHRHVLITTTPSKVHIDENGMLQGAGLYSRFYTRFFDDAEDAVMPVWFNAKVRAVVEENAEGAAARRAPTGMNGTKP